MTDVVEFDDFSIESSHETPAQVKASVGEGKLTTVTEDVERQSRSKQTAVVEDAKPEGGVIAVGEVDQTPEEKAADAEEKAEKADADRVAEAKTPEEKADAEEARAARRRGNPRHDAKARMLQATREAAELRRANEELRQRLEALETTKDKPDERRVAPVDDEKPKASDFEDLEDYLEARDAYNRKQWERVAVQRREQEKVFQGINTQLKTFKERVTKLGPEFGDQLSSEVIELTPTYLLEPGQRPGPLNVVADEIISSTRAPELMLHLSEHPEELQRLATLRSSDDVIREVARLEVGLGAATTATPAPKTGISRAKPPARAVAGSPVAADHVPSDESSYDDHAAYMNNRDGSRRSVRR